LTKAAAVDEASRLSAIIGNLYDASLDQRLWSHVLGEARDFVGGAAASLFWKEAASKSGGVSYDDGGLDPHYQQLYFERYAELDPCMNAHVFAPVGEPVAVADCMPYDEFLETRLYQEWGRPRKLVDFVSVALDKSATSAAMFGVFREERRGLVGDVTRRRMRLLAPHLRRAVLIGKTIDLKAGEAAAFADALDGLSAAMFLTEGSARIVHANAAGHAMLADADFLCSAGGRLVARDARTNRALTGVLASAECGDAAIGTLGVGLPFVARDGERYAGHVLPLTSGARKRTGAAYAASAAIFVHKTAQAFSSPPEAIARHYRLTPTELRVLLAIVEVGGVPEVAEAPRRRWQHRQDASRQPL
jgi:hypothetical protein